MKDMNMYAMSKLDGEGAMKMGVASKTGQWWGVELLVPNNAAVLDFVFSDADGRQWDNNGMRDYHVQVGADAVAQLPCGRHIEQLVTWDHNSYARLAAFLVCAVDRTGVVSIYSLVTVHTTAEGDCLLLGAVFSGSLLWCLQEHMAVRCL